jgi:hypothetical protein
MHLSDAHTAKAQGVLLRQAEVALEGGGRAAAEAAFARCLGISGGALAPDVAVQGALLQAALAKGPEERAAALENACVRASGGEVCEARLRAALSRARFHLDEGRLEEAAQDARTALEVARAEWKSLPEWRRDAYLSRSTRKATVALGREVRQRLPSGAGKGGATPATSLENLAVALDGLLSVLEKKAPDLPRM